MLKIKLLALLCFTLCTSIIYGETVNYKLSNYFISKISEIKNTNKLLKTSYNRLNKNDLTVILMEAKKNWKKLSPEAQKIVADAGGRPDGPFKTYDESVNKFFRFYYKTTGASDSTVSTTDANSNGIPDYVESMASAFNTMLTKYVGAGYAKPPLSPGDTRFPVYITNAGNGVYGFVAGEFRIGDNPNTTAKEKLSVSSFMVMRNNYAGFGSTVTEQNEAMQVTSAHEFMHAIQNGYGPDSMSVFLMEIGATWGEDYIYKGLDDNFQYLPTLFTQSDFPLDYLDEEDITDVPSGHWYSSWLFMRYLSDNYGLNIPLKIYENTAKNNTYCNTSIASTLPNANSAAFLKSVKDFYTAMYMLSQDSLHHSPYYFSRANDYKTKMVKGFGKFSIKPEATVKIGTSIVNYSSKTTGNSRLMRLGCDYIKLTPASNFSIAITSLNDHNIAARLLAIDSTVTPATVSVVDQTYNSASPSSFKFSVADYKVGKKYMLMLYNTTNLTATYPRSATTADYSIVFDPNGVANEDIKVSPKEFTLSQNYPNPFNPSTNIRFTLPEAGNVKISIFNTLGQEVKTIINEFRNSGNHSVSFNASELSSGTYFYKLESGKYSKTMKMMLIK